jgi:hypothetical protein
MEGPKLMMLKALPVFTIGALHDNSRDKTNRFDR